MPEMFSLQILDGSFTSGFGRFIDRLAVRYLVQMIFGIPVSGFEKKVKKLFGRRCSRFSKYAEFGLEESCGGGEDGLSGKERDDTYGLGPARLMTSKTCSKSQSSRCYAEIAQPPRAPNVVLNANSIR
jgi:hypothetical protein